MNSQQFDDILKNKLNGLTSDKTPDWGLFTQAKHLADKADGAPDATDELFDDEVRHTLSEHLTTSAPQWSAFLDSKSKFESKEKTDEQNNDFDKEIKVALDEAKDLSRPQWGAFLDFKSKLPNIIEEDTETNDLNDDGNFDQTLREQLLNYKTPTAPQWSALQQMKQVADKDHVLDQKHSDFDDRVRAALALAVTTTTPDWSGFKDKLSEAPDTDVDFDQEVQSTLDAHTTDAQPDWSAFQNFRKDYDNNNDFDTEVKEQLEDLTSEKTPDWSAFQNFRKDFDNNNFDTEVKEQLEDLTSTKTPDWSAFIEKKREADRVATDVGFDKGVQSSIEQLSKRYNSQHWLLLRARLRRIAALRKNIFSYKGLEIAFVCLMLLSFGNYMGPVMDRLIKTESSTAVEAAPAMAQGEKSDTENIVAADVEDNSAVIATEQEEIIAERTLPSSSTSGRSGGRNIIENNKPSFNTDNFSQSSAVTATTSSATEINNLGSNTQKNTSLVADKNETITRALMEKLSVIKGFERIAAKREFHSPQSAIVIDRSKKKVFIDEGSWLHFFASVEDNFIQTPINDEAGLNLKNHESVGHNFEVLFSRMKGKWEYEFGLGYNYLNYDPFTNYTQEAKLLYENEKSDNSVVFNRIRLDMISIPIKLKYHFISNGRWSIFGGLGLNNELIALSEYDITDTEVTPVPMIPGQPVRTPDWPELYDQRVYTKGLFNKGELHEAYSLATRNNNFILRANVGLGAERNLGDNVAAYVRGNYKHTLLNSDIGPYNDQINKLTFGMGFKFRLK